MKRHILIFLGILTAIFATSLLKSDSVNAYYTGLGSGEQECYALMLSPTQHTKAICSDKKGGLSSIEDNKDIPTLQQLSQNGNTPKELAIPQLTLTSKKAYVKLTYCTTGTIVVKPSGAQAGGCAKGGERKIEYFKIKDYKTFRELAEAIQDFATKNKYTPMNIDDNADGSNQCKSASKHLGWIICPIIETASSAADKVYTNYIAPALSIDPKIFASSDSSAEDAWGTFRNFANIIFIILFLIIIFSQLTGVGIDNYGIKKALPKMVVGAVLINLSYVLCVVAVDISNILGNAFYALFTTLGENLKPELGSDLVGSAKSFAVTGGSLVGLGVLGTLAAYSVVWNPATLISILIAAITLVVSIFFLFILLSMREAAIIVLIVISPIAVVLYALPNTKSYFNKWLKFFGALLMVYPIASLLVGGGNYVSALLLSTGMASGFASALSAMIIGVAPIFFIPAVLKKSMAAAGNIGAKISGFGQKAGAKLGGASGRAVEKSARFQNLQREAARSKKLRDATAIKNRYGKKDYSSLSDAQKRALGYSTATIQAADREDIDAAKAYINKQTNNGADTEKLFALGDAAAARGDKTAQRAALEIAGRRADTANAYANHILDSRGTFDATEAKEIAEGANAANFRSSSPVNFQYASDINSGKDGVESSINDYMANSANIDNAIKNHITSAEDIMSMKNSELRKLQKLTNDGKMSSGSAEQLQKIIADVNAKAAAGTITVDRTKMDNINGVVGIQGPPVPPST